VTYRFIRLLGQIVLVLFFGYRAYGLRNVAREGGVIIACNHQSFIDPVAVGSALRRRFGSLARASLFKHWAFGRLLRLLGSMPLDRGSADVGAMRQGLQLLKQGGALLLFPEGTRTLDGEIGELQSGLAVLASRSGAWVVPTIIDGAYECWPRQRAFPKLGKVRVAFGRPMKYSGHGSAEAKVFVQELRERMVALQAGLRDGRVPAGRANL